MGLFRVATLEDAAGILEIYAPIVRETVISFELEPPTLEEMSDRIAKILKGHPWLIYEEDGKVAGYAYASKQRERAAYQWNTEVSVYVHPDHRRKGLARQLYTKLFEILRQQGFYNAYAGITLPNLASVEAHEAVGFQALTIMEETGYKFGKWHDVGWWQLALQPKAAEPTPPVAFEKLAANEIQAVLG